jgi:uncharacterized membrane protein
MSREEAHHMRAKLRNLWENLSTSLWFIPTLLVAAAILQATILIAIDAREAGGAR